MVLAEVRWLAVAEGEEVVALALDDVTAADVGAVARFAFGLFAGIVVVAVAEDVAELLVWVDVGGGWGVGVAEGGVVVLGLLGLFLAGLEFALLLLLELAGEEVRAGAHAARALGLWSRAGRVDLTVRVWREDLRCAGSSLGGLKRRMVARLWRSGMGEAGGSRVRRVRERRRR
jgi:hypothetical protein